MPVQDRLHLLLSLLIFLQLSLMKVLQFMFTTNANEVRKRASMFMAYRPSGVTDESKFAPRSIFRVWLHNFPESREHLNDMLMPFAEEIAAEESNRMIRDDGLKVKMKTLTLKDIQGFLEPQCILQIYREHAPFTWAILHTFASLPNKSRKQQKRCREAQHEYEDDEPWEDDPNLPDDEPEKRWEIPKMPEGFSRNPDLVSMTQSALDET